MLFRFHNISNTTLHEIVTSLRAEWPPGLAGVSSGVGVIKCDSVIVSQSVIASQSVPKCDSSPMSHCVKSVGV